MNRQLPVGLELRSIQIDDSAKLATLDRRCFPSPWTEGSFRTMLEVPGTEGLVLLPTEAPRAGPATESHAYVLWSRIADEAELLRIGVRRDLRRRGLASALLDRMIERLTIQGVGIVYLEVRRGNTGAIELYRRFGFTQTGLRPGYYDNGEDALVMASRTGPGG